MNAALVVALLALALHVFQLRGVFRRFRSSEQRKQTAERFLAMHMPRKRESERLVGELRGLAKSAASAFADPQPANSSRGGTRP